MVLTFFELVYTHYLIGQVPILPGHEIITADTIEQIYLNYGSAMAFRCPSVQPVYTCARPSVRYVAIFVKLALRSATLLLNY